MSLVLATPEALLSPGECKANETNFSRSNKTSYNVDQFSLLPTALVVMQSVVSVSPFVSTLSFEAIFDLDCLLCMDHYHRSPATES